MAYARRLNIKLTSLNNEDINMGTVTLSSKFQVVIPRDIREKLNLIPGQKIVVIEKDGVLHLIPQKPIKEMRGFVKDINTQDIRDEEDRLNS
jgi:AbrB family looped-hinge helix DNA binding protein